MQLDNYSFVKTKESHRYEFNSSGPKGVVRKIVLYDNKYFQPIPIFNLAFGDWDTITGGLNDFIITNNKDRRRILSTVAATVLDFIHDRPNAVLYAAGSTPVRNRLYRMGIGLIWDEIKEEMDLYGRINKLWHHFTRNANFDAFVRQTKA